MPTSYTGLYVVRAEDGSICSVHVVDSDGNTFHIQQELYFDQGVKPPIEQLPDEKVNLILTEGVYSKNTHQIQYH